VLQTVYRDPLQPIGVRIRCAVMRATYLGEHKLCKMPANEHKLCKTPANQCTLTLLPFDYFKKNIPRTLFSLRRLSLAPLVVDTLSVCKAPLPAAPSA
jgi:hypothetical protein